MGGISITTPATGAIVGMLVIVLVLAMTHFISIQVGG
jgi:hypothetical protein